MFLFNSIFERHFLKIFYLFFYFFLFMDDFFLLFVYVGKKKKSFHNCTLSKNLLVIYSVYIFTVTMYSFIHFLSTSSAARQ